MRIFKNLWFSRFAEREGIPDDDLKALVNRLEAGQIDADLGGGVYKQRVARPGAGKSGGYRVILFFRSGDRAFFHFGFAKANQDNISPKDLKILKQTAKKELAMIEEQINIRLKNGTLFEIV